MLICVGLDGQVLVFWWQVVLLDLEALAEISSNPAGLQGKTAGAPSPSKTKTKDSAESDSPLNEYFSKFMSRLLEMFRKERQLLEPDERGYFIIRCLIDKTTDFFHILIHLFCYMYMQLIFNVKIEYHYYR